MRFEQNDIESLAAALKPAIREAVSEAFAEHAMAQHPQPWMSRRQLAEHFHVAEHVVRDCESRGEIEGIRVGKQARYQLSEVEQALTKSKDF